MKFTTRFMMVSVLIISISLATAAVAFLVETRSEAENAALSEQDKCLKTFWRMLKAKGDDFRIVDDKLMVGDTVLNGNYKLPDVIHDIFGGTATIFMRDVRVSTNVLQPDGRRAIGTRLTGPAYDAVFRQGQSYRGEAPILGISYFTAYDPIRNGKGEVIGALYVGVQKSSYFSKYDRLKTRIIATTSMLMLIFSLLTLVLIRIRRKADSAIQESMERIRAAFETIPDYVSISTVDEGVWIDVNPGFTDVTGYTRDEVVGKSSREFSLWCDPSDREMLLETIREHGSVNNMESTFCHKDGHIIYVSMSARIIHLHGKPYLFGFVKNITESRKAAIALDRLNRVLRTLTGCHEILVRAENEEILLNDVCRVIFESGSYTFAWAGYAENDDRKTIRPVAQAGCRDGYLDRANLTWADTEQGSGPSGTAIRSGRPCLLKDIVNDPLCRPWRERALQQGYRSIFAAPLAYSGKVIGSLSFYASEPDSFDAEEQDLIMRLAADLAYAIISLRTREKHMQTAQALFESAREYQKLATAHDQKQRLLHALLDSIPDLIFYKDPQGVYLGCNKAFEAYAGRPEDNIAGITDLDIFPRDVAEYFRDMDRLMLAERKARRNEEWVVYPDGRRVLLDTMKTPFFDHNGNILGLIGVSRDITLQRRQDEEREQLKTQLHQAQKMEAIGQLAGGIAHDFNNILTAIMGYSEILRLRLDKGSPLQHHIEQVLLAAGRATELTNGLLAFSRKQVLHTKHLDLCEVVRGLQTMLGRLIPEDIDFRTTIFERPLIIMADKGQIEQVIMNLVTNAKDAMPRGGALAIEIVPVYMDSGFVHAHGFGEPGQYARISVSDSGHGMDEETQKKIFEPFFTTKELGKGTGLGMAIIYGIVKQHRGYIIVLSKPESGTTIHVYLPQITEENRISKAADPEDQAVGGTETILLVEDDPTVRELHSMILEHAGYTIIQATDGMDAMEKFLEHQESIRILVTDVIMPKMDGKKLFEEIKKRRPEMKALFMSGYTRDIFLERGIAEVNQNFVSKPVSASELQRRVRSILDLDN